MQVTMDALNAKQITALIVRAAPCCRWKTDICLHSTKDACNEDLRDKILGYGTAHQQLPRSPTIKILQTLGNFPGSRGEVLPSPRVWRGHQRLSTRDWNLELHSNSAVTGGQVTHTHVGDMLVTCWQHVASTAKCRHFWPTSPCCGYTKLIPSQYFCVGDCQHSPLSS